MSYLANPNSLTGGPFNTDAASHNTGFFSDNTNPSSVNCNVLPAPSSNVIAASGKWTGGKRRRRSTRNRSTRKRKRRRGGTTNNVPNTPSYATGTELPYGLSALANPAPYWKLDNATNCTDNYNHFTGGKRSGKKRSGKKRRRSSKRSSKKRRSSKRIGG